MQNFLSLYMYNLNLFSKYPKSESMLSVEKKS